MSTVYPVWDSTFQQALEMDGPKGQGREGTMVTTAWLRVSSAPNCSLIKHGLAWLQSGVIRGASLYYWLTVVIGSRLTTACSGHIDCCLPSLPLWSLPSSATDAER